MNFVAILSAILTFIRYIPELLKVCKEVYLLIRAISDRAEAKQKAQDIAAAIKKAKDTKDTGDLEGLFGKKSFDIEFKEEKKSLDLGLLYFDTGFGVNLVIPESEIDDLTSELDSDFKEFIDELSQKEDIELPVGDSKYFDTQDAIAEDLHEEEPKEEEKPKVSLFGFMSSVPISPGGTFVNHVRMTDNLSMGSKFL